MTWETLNAETFLSSSLQLRSGVDVVDRDGSMLRETAVHAAAADFHIPLSSENALSESSEVRE